MRRAAKELRAKGKEAGLEACSDNVSLRLELPTLLFALASRLLALCSVPPCIASHHWVKTITANGIPSRNPLCGTSKLVTAFPHRHPWVTSGRIVYEC